MRKRCILVVEDESQVRTLLAKLLEKNDYEVATAFQGGETVKTNEERKVANSVTNERLPTRCGRAIRKRI